MSLNKKIYKNLVKKMLDLKKENKEPKINILGFDLETTGLKHPIEVTQFGGVIMPITLDKDNNIVFLNDFTNVKDDEKITKFYYPENEINPEAAIITHIIRNKDFQNPEYRERLEKELEKKGKKLKDIKFTILEDVFKIEYDQTDKNISFEEFLKTKKFKKEDFEKFIKDNQIELLSGHNVYGYDYKKVLRNNYNVSIDNINVFDTLLKEINEYTINKEGKYIQERKTFTNQKLETVAKKDLQKLTKKILQKKSKKEIEEHFKELMDIRDSYHDALYDVLLNTIPIQNKILEIEEKYKEETLIELENKEEQVKKELRNYLENDILYLRTNISSDTILTSKNIYDFCYENNIKEIIIVDESPSHVFKDQETLQKHKIFEKFPDFKIKRGFKVLNKDNNEYYDILIPNTVVYRKILPLFINMEVTDEILNDIKKYYKEDNFIILESKKIPIPTMNDFKDLESYFLNKKMKRNMTFTEQEKDFYLENAKMDLSLKTGKLTNDNIQKFLKEKTQNFENIDFAFYSKLKKSAFPKLSIIYDKVKEEPKTIQEFIQHLRNFINEKWEEKTFDEKIKVTNLEREKNNLPIFKKEDYLNRIEEEISILEKMGNTDFIKYFFLVTDWNKYISYGYGRGSAAGSIIAYILGITDTDPLKYELLFERFMDPSRKDYPDIDLDIMYKDYTFQVLNNKYNEKMAESIDYSDEFYSIFPKEIIEKYIKPKKNFFSKISALSYTTKKTVINNALRLGGLSQLKIKEISKELKDRLEENSTSSILEDLQTSTYYEEIKERFGEDYLNSLDNLVKLFSNYGVHAGGLIATPVHPFLMTLVKDDMTTYFSKDDVEKNLMIKMDLLGLNTRVIVQKIHNLIKESILIKKGLITREKINMLSINDYNKLLNDNEDKIKEEFERKIFINNKDMLNDANVLSQMSEGLTSMTFQLESGGMKKILKELAPINFDDVIAAVALFRPGPLGSGAVDDFIAAANLIKRKKYNIEYIELKEFKQLKKSNPDEVKKLIEDIRTKMLKDYDKVQLSDEVIENLITLGSYFESNKFKNPLREYFNITRKDDTNKIEVYEEIIKEYNIKNEEEFIKVLTTLEEELKENETFAEITKDTNKTIIYQEQIMKLSVKAANYSGGEANDLRKAIGKKIKEKMKLHGTKLVEGLSKTKENSNIKPMSEILAKYLWYKIEKFGEYAFNKSHAASYSVLAYETQYLKFYNPMEFYTINLQECPEKHRDSLIREIKKQKINLELQSFGKSFSNKFIFEGNTIYVPINYAKGIGEKNIYPLISILNEYNIESLEEMIVLLDKVDKTLIEKLGSIGTFDNNFSYTTPKEWFYLSNEKDNSDKTILIDNIYKDIFSKEQKKLEKYKVKDSKNKHLEELYNNKKLISSLDVLNQVSLSFNNMENTSDDENEDNTSVDTKIYEDIEKQIDSIYKEIDKIKNSDLKELLYEQIDLGNYTFFKEGKFKEEYENYKTFNSNQAKIVAKKMREDVIKKYSENEKIITKIINEKLKDSDNNIKYSFNNRDSLAELTQKEKDEKYLEMQINIFSSEFSKDLPKEQIFNIKYESVKEPKINVLIIDEYLQGFPQSRNTFLKDINKTIKNKNVNIGYFHFYDENKFQAKNSTLSEEEKEQDFEERFGKLINALLDNNIEQVILSSDIAKNSMLRRRIENFRERTFQPKNGEYANIFIKNKKGKRKMITFYFSSGLSINVDKRYLKQKNSEEFKEKYEKSMFFYEKSVNDITKLFNTNNHFKYNEDNYINETNELIVVEEKKEFIQKELEELEFISENRLITVSNEIEENREIIPTIVSEIEENKEIEQKEVNTTEDSKNILEVYEKELQDKEIKNMNDLELLFSEQKDKYKINMVLYIEEMEEILDEKSKKLKIKIIFKDKNNNFNPKSIYFNINEQNYNKYKEILQRENIVLVNGNFKNSLKYGNFFINEVILLSKEDIQKTLTEEEKIFLNFLNEIKIYIEEKKEYFYHNEGFIKDLLNNNFNNEEKNLWVEKIVSLLSRNDKKKKEQLKNIYLDIVFNKNIKDLSEIDIDKIINELIKKEIITIKGKFINLNSKKVIEYGVDLFSKKNQYELKRDEKNNII